MKKILAAWYKTNRAILINAFSLVGTTAVTSGCGFIYWWVAARTFPLNVVGTASASISIMLLLGAIGIFGFGTTLIGELAREKQSAIPLIFTATVITGIGGMVCGLVFIEIAPYLSNDFKPFVENYANVFFFALGVSLTSITLVLDQALIGLLHGEIQLWRNIIFAVVKLILISLLGLWGSDKTGVAIYITWLVGNIISLLYLLLIATRKGISLHDYRLKGRLVGNLGRKAITNHLLNLTFQAPSQILPLLTTAILSAIATAYFYTAWMLVWFILVVPSSLSTVLYAIGSANPGELALKLRFTLKFSLVFAIGATLFFWLGGELLLSFFGNAYAENAGLALRVLILGIFPAIVKVHFIAINRIYGNIKGLILPIAMGAVLVVTLAGIGTSLLGITGVCLGWLLGEVIQSIFMLPLVYKTAFPSKLPFAKDSQKEIRTLISDQVLKVSFRVSPDPEDKILRLAKIPEIIELELSQKKSSVILGRHSECDLVLPFISISRQHAEIRVCENKLLLRDLQSTNKTFINGKGLASDQLYLLSPGDDVKLGMLSLKLQLVTVSPGIEKKIITKAEPVNNSLTLNQKKMRKLSFYDFVFLGLSILVSAILGLVSLSTHSLTLVGAVVTVVLLVLLVLKEIGSELKTSLANYVSQKSYFVIVPLLIFFIVSTASKLLQIINAR